MIHPPIDRPKMKADNLEFQDVAIAVGYPQPEQGTAVDLAVLTAQRRAAADDKVVLLDKDFEDDNLAPFSGTGPGVSIVASGAGAGTRSLRLEEVEGLDHDWMPSVSTAVSFPADRAAGAFRLSADVKLDAAAPGEVGLFLRDQKPGQPYRSGGDVRIGNGGLKVGWRNAMAIEPGTWYHLEISGRFGPDTDKQLTVSATTAAGRSRTVTVPYDNIHFEQPNNIGLTGNGPPGSAVQIDNLVLTVED